MEEDFEVRSITQQSQINNNCEEINVLNKRGRGHKSIKMTSHIEHASIIL